MYSKDMHERIYNGRVRVTNSDNYVAEQNTLSR